MRAEFWFGRGGAGVGARLALGQGRASRGLDFRLGEAPDRVRTAFRLGQAPGLEEGRDEAALELAFGLRLGGDGAGIALKGDVLRHLPSLGLGLGRADGPAKDRSAFGL